MRPIARRPLLRSGEGHDRSRVSMIELFFDLVFVFAVTQLSHRLLEQLTPLGAMQTAMLFLGIWWLWIYTTWVTNWLDPDHPAARLLLFALMLAGLVVSSSVPHAFTDKGLVFALAFAASQLMRTLFMLYAYRNGKPGHKRNFQRILVLFCISSTLWIAGGLSQGETRIAWWLAALAMEYIGPSTFFYIPGLGRSSPSDWDIDPHHMAERCGLFVIIALGESLLVTGATFADLPWTPSHILAFLVAFVGSLAMWWLYFDSGSERAARVFKHSDDPSRLARNAYTYLHLLIVAGIIVSAVADELILAHPDHASDAGIAAILSGPFLYLLGNAWFKWVTNARRGPPFSHLLGLLLLLGIAPLAFGHLFSALTLGALTTGILVFVGAWEWAALRRPAKHAAPSA